MASILLGARLLVAGLVVLFSAASAMAASLVEEEVTIRATIRGWTYSLAALSVRPAEASGPLPLVLMTHGSPRDAAERPKFRPQIMRLQARDFAYRGWLVVAFIRRGFGPSEGPYAEGYDCARPNYVRALATAADDIEAVRLAVSHWPMADASRVLGVGQSLGGAAMLSWAARHPPGLVGVVNISGGAGSFAPRLNCDENGLMNTFASLGADVRTPTLWLYANNDLYFPQDVIRRMHHAFSEAGGPADLTIFGPVGHDGHDLFFTFDGKRLWLPVVDRFLTVHQWPTWNRGPLDAVDRSLGSDARRTLAYYLAAPAEKALAVSASNNLARYRANAGDLGIVRKESVQECERDSGEQCRVLIENFTPVRDPGHP